MNWADNLNSEEKKTVAYIREQAKRIGELYNVKISDDIIRHIFFSDEEHLTDSHQLCDVIDLVARVISET